MSTRKSPLREQVPQVARITGGFSTRQPRITPRNSDGDDIAAFAAAEETPYGTLRQLANFPKPSTPLRRASSAGPPSHRSTRRTPTAQTRTPGAVQRPGGSAIRPNAVTPHGRAAIRELEARRAGLTPGKDRRRSGRQQKETPRNDLRLLSRLMAPKTEPVVPTPQGAVLFPGRFTLGRTDDLDDGPDPVRPRLSLPLGDEDDEDDSLLLPPKSAGLEDENHTVQSIELPRRAISEQPPGRRSRGSFGSVRMSDQFADLNELGIRGVFDSSFATAGAFDEGDVLEINDIIQEENTTNLSEMDFERRSIFQASGRESDIRLGTSLADDTENTFVFTLPPRDVPGPQTSIDHPDSSTVGYNNSNNREDRINELNPATLYSAKYMETDTSIVDNTVQDVETTATTIVIPAKKRKMRISKHGIQYPSLPAAVVKKLATQYARTGGNGKAKINKDTMAVIMQATDWFFEQVSDDLGAYSKHAGRKTIDESDIVTLMKRQRQTNATTTPFSLAQRILPRELLQELRMVPPPKLKKRQQLEQVDEVDEG